MMLVRSVFVFCLGLLSAAYLLNVGFGIGELVPDNLPGFGNLDEALATVLLLNALAYFGLDLRRFLARRDDARRLHDDR